MIDFSHLAAALEQAKDTGRLPVFWWRDDDAGTHTPALDRLLSIRKRFSLPLALAVIPATLDHSLALRLRREQGVSVLVHGLSHANHAPVDQKKAEFGPHRSLDKLVSEASKGLQHLSAAFASGFLVPVFVPPWNRVDTALVPYLAGIGYSGLSTFGNRTPRMSGGVLKQINTHLDPIAWHQGGSLVAVDRLIRTLTELVLQRTRGETDEPIGILTHHLVQDDAVWSFCETLFEHLLRSEAIVFKGADHLFQSASTATTLIDQSSTRPTN